MKKSRMLAVAALALAIVFVTQSIIMKTAKAYQDPTWNVINNGDFSTGDTSGWIGSSSVDDPSWARGYVQSVGSSWLGENIVTLYTGADGWMFGPGHWAHYWLTQYTWESVNAPNRFGPLMVYAHMTHFQGYSGTAWMTGIVLNFYHDSDGSYVGSLEYMITGQPSNFQDSPQYKYILLTASTDSWIGLSSDSQNPGRNVKADYESKYGTAPSDLVVGSLQLHSYMWSGWLGGYTLSFFGGVRLGYFPTVIGVWTSTKEIDGSNPSAHTVQFSWIGTVPTNCLTLDGTKTMYPLRGGVTYDLLLKLATTVTRFSGVSSPCTVDFSELAKGRYSVWVEARSAADGVTAATGTTEVLNGHTLTVNTHWLTSATGAAELSYVQHVTTKYVSLSDTSTLCTVIVDPNSAASLPTDASYSVGNYRVHSYDSPSWTISSSGGKDVYYYGQYWASIATSGLVSSYPATVSVVQGATSYQPTTSGAWSDWADYNSALSISSTLTVSSTERYHSPNTVSWTVNSYQFSQSVAYYHQWKPTVTISGLPDSTHSVNATYTKDGSLVAQPNLWTGSWSDWVDDGATLSFNKDSKVSAATQRWHTYGTNSWTVGSPFSSKITYIRQEYLTLNPLDYQGNPLSRTVSVEYTGDDGGNKANGTYTTVFSASWSRWMNYGTVLKVAKLASGSSATNQWYCYFEGGGWSLSRNWRYRQVLAGATYALTYWHQFRPELELYTSQYGWKVYDNAQHFAVGDWVLASAWLNETDVEPPLAGSFTFTLTDPSGNSYQFSVPSASMWFHIPQSLGTWKFNVVWNDSTSILFNNTQEFYVWTYNVALTNLVENGSNLNMTVSPTISPVATPVPSWNYFVAVTGGTGESNAYTKGLNYAFYRSLVQVDTISTKFFWASGQVWTWSAHFRNLDPNSAHCAALMIIVTDPVTGHVYLNGTSTPVSLAIGGEGDAALRFYPSEGWCRNGLFRVTYAFLCYDSVDVFQGASPRQDYGNADPVSWLMVGGSVNGVSNILAVYSGTAPAGRISAVIQVPESILRGYNTVNFYLSWEDQYGLSTPTQVVPAAMSFVNVTYRGANVFASGCTPPSRWVTWGAKVTLSVETPFYPEPPYYSSTTRFIFLNWNWTQGSQWLSDSATTLSLEVAGPLQVVAWWRAQFLVEFTPYVPTTAPTDTVQVSYTANNTVTHASVRSASTLSVWVDNYTKFTMHDLWVNDYTWYAVNYDQPSKTIVGGVSLTLNYVEGTNQVSSVDTESNKFEAGGTLQLNVTLTTTYYNAGWINATIIVASRNTILVDRNGLAWSNMRIQLQNNTAMIVVPLPQDIGNGTLTILLKAYGRVEPTTTQIVLTSSTVPPEQGGGGDDFLGGTGVDLTPTIAFMGIAFGIVFGASVSVKAMMGRMKSRRRDRDALAEAEPLASKGETTANAAPTASAVMSEGDRVTEPQPLSLVRALALMELDVEKGVQLSVLKDGSSRFIRYLKRDVTRCGDYFDTAAKSYPGTLSITKWGDHITFIPYSTRGGSGRGRRMKSILIVSTTRELRNSEVRELTKTMCTKPINMSGESA